MCFTNAPTVIRMKRFAHLILTQVAPIYTGTKP
uniref:Uncharacterized protein n=1 Tax=Daphnia galeata TaxID=27404 RepID=A0A8J2WLL1_9CRUS|nr:unnamed protein product [Daphnia galeata]